MNSSELLTVILATGGAAFGAWGAIRFALGQLEARLNHVHELATLARAEGIRAHDRIDKVLSQK